MRTRFVDGTDEAPTEVPNTSYYRRGLLRGDVREPVKTTPKKGA